MSQARKENRQGRVQNVSKARFQYSPAKVNQALNAISEGMPVAKASRTFAIPRTTLRNKISGKFPRGSRHCGFESHLGKEVEEQLVEWILTCAKMGFPIDKDGLLTSVQKLVRGANIKTPFVNDRPGKKWYYSFLNRHKQLSQKKAEYIHGGRGAVTEEKIRKWFDEIYTTLNNIGANGVLEDPRRIFNMDETSFCLAPKSGTVIGPRGKHIYDERTSSDKENVTTLFTVNATGHFAPPLTIFKYDRIPSAVAKAAPKGWGLGKSEKGWMTADCFFEYFSNVFVPYLKESQIEFPIVVFLDGHKSHLTLHLSKFCRANEIILIALVPNATHILQPLDVVVFAAIKSKWRHFVRRYRIDNNGQEITKSCLPLALSQLIEDPNMASNIISGFKSTGLYPFSVNNVDYSKIILRQSDMNQVQNKDTAAADHLKYLESKIDLVLIDQFKQTKRRNHEWEGNIEDKSLYNVWLQIAKAAESRPQLMSEDSESEHIDLPNDSMLSDVPLDASIPICSEKQAPTTSNNINTVITSTYCADKIEQVKRNICFAPKSICSTVFRDVLPYPQQKESHTGKKRKKEYIPSVVISEKWVNYYEESESLKSVKEQQKQERKQARELKKQMKEQENGKNLRRKTGKAKQRDAGSESSSEELGDWMESGSSGDDIDYIVPEQEACEMLVPNKLTFGDFVPVKFKLAGKRSTKTYRYAAKILEIESSEEYRIQCYKSADEGKTVFYPIENDISSINKCDILGKLPNPNLQPGRMCKTIFPGQIDVCEQM